MPVFRDVLLIFLFFRRSSNPEEELPENIERELIDSVERYGSILVYQDEEAAEPVTEI